MNRKALPRVEIKDADKGLVDLVFATYNEVDKDGDVTIPGAFEDGAKVPVSAYMHTSWEGRLPVGVATIDAKSDREASARAQFFMDTTEGRDTFTVVKRLAAEGLGEWSYGYDPERFDFGDFNGQKVRFLYKQRVKEISPVLEGAGTQTRTTGVKRAGTGAPPVAAGGGWSGVFAPHFTETSAKAWRPNDVMDTLGVFPAVDDLRAVHAYVDPSGDPARKTSYRFLHHEAPGGPANLRACMLGIAALNGAPGPVVPDGVKSAVYAHLAGHLEDAGRYVPPLADGSGSLKFAERGAIVIATIADFIDHAAEVGASRALKGKHLTGSNRELLTWLDEEMARMRTLLDTPQETMAKELLRAIALKQGRAI